MQQFGPSEWKSPFLDFRDQRGLNKQTFCPYNKLWDVPKRGLEKCYNEQKKDKKEKLNNGNTIL